MVKKQIVPEEYLTYYSYFARKITESITQYGLIIDAVKDPN